MAVDPDGVYHERQRLQFCLLRCLNNLLQGENAFTRRELDTIADNIKDPERAATPNPVSFIFKPHRNAMTGNYDVEVLIKALDSRGKELEWFDGRKGIEGLLPELAQYGDDKLLGMIVNFTTRKCLGLCQGRHWVAFRKLKPEGWYNLDSERAAPVCLGNDDALKEFLRPALTVPTDNYVLLVLNKPPKSSQATVSTSKASPTDNVSLDGTDNAPPSQVTDSTSKSSPTGNVSDNDGTDNAPPSQVTSGTSKASPTDKVSDNDGTDNA